jgi:hypothetical protein
MEFLPESAFHSLTKIPEEDEDMWHMCLAAHHHSTVSIVGTNFDDQ